MPPPRPRRHAAVWAAVIATCLLTAGVAENLRVQMHLHNTAAQVAAARSSQRQAAAALDAARRALGPTEAESAQLRTRMTDVSSELASTKDLVTEAQSGLAARAVQIGAVHSCAGGVSRSVTALNGGNQSGAVADLRSVAPVCESLLDAGTGGPVYPFDFADPDVLVVKGRAYAYGTNAAAGTIQVMESNDLVHWKRAGNALPTLASWARPGYTWAPAVIHLQHTYVLYYTASATADRVQCLSVATARRPQGPFVDRSRVPLECQPALGGSIDPSPYVDDDGQPYLAWKSNGAGGQPSTLWAEALDPQGTALDGPGPVAMLQPSQAWEGSVVEAPSMVRAGGSYALFYSGNNWNSADYAIGLARCRGPLGPCTKPLSKPLFGSASNLVGPGGADVFTGGGGQLEMAFHAWLPGAVGYPHSRLLFVRRLTVTDSAAHVDS